MISDAMSSVVMTGRRIHRSGSDIASGPGRALDVDTRAIAQRQLAVGHHGFAAAEAFGDHRHARHVILEEKDEVAALAALHRLVGPRDHVRVDAYRQPYARQRARPQPLIL